MKTKKVVAFAILLAAFGIQAQETKNSSKNTKKPKILVIPKQMFKANLE
jgi:hypothetical protein